MRIKWPMGFPLSSIKSNQNSDARQAYAGAEKMLECCCSSIRNRLCREHGPVWVLTMKTDIIGISFFIGSSERIV